MTSWKGHRTKKRCGNCKLLYWRKHTCFRKKITCFYCGDETRGQGHHITCLSWKRNIKGKNTTQHKTLSKMGNYIKDKAKEH